MGVPSLTPRRRVFLTCVLFLGLGLAGPAVFRGIDQLVPCDTPLLTQAQLCSSAHGYSSDARWILGGFGVGILLAAAYAAARLSQRPLLALVTMIDRLGPLNLNERSGFTSTGDETHELAMALDKMMDRVAIGYEGQRRFAANASHELRTPLAVQRALIEVSLATARTQEQRQMLGAQLLATNERNVNLIEGLLVLSESERGLATCSDQRLDDIAEDVVKAHQEFAELAGVTLTLQSTGRVVPGERVLLERLVTNLVVNAISYNRAGGTVIVTVGADPALVVENTGNSVPAESVAGLFEPFKRGTVDRVTQGRGAGLGLAIVRSVAQAHRGVVAARPGPDGGLVIDVQLPAS